jgi:hypothetical protein
MSRPLELKPISREGVAQALDKAERYRLLNEPDEAESICLDVLLVDPEEQRALRVLVLAITDQFERGRVAREAEEHVAKLVEPYERSYYAGIVREREARAFLSRPMGRFAAHAAFQDALAHYQEAEAIRPAGNDDARLRWNSCVRTMRRERVEPPPDQGELPLE